VKRRRHTLEQIVRKLREADRLLGEGMGEASTPTGFSGSRRRTTCLLDQQQFSTTSPAPRGAQCARSNQAGVSHPRVHSSL
jgi:hypothetical protein